MEILNKLIEYIINYGNCEFFVRDCNFQNAAFKYMFLINDENKITIRRYWYEYKWNLDSEDKYLESTFIGGCYLGNNFCVNLSEVVASSIKNECFCTYNIALENNNGDIFAKILISFLKNILMDYEELLNEYFKGDKDRFVALIISKAFSLLIESESIKECPIPLEDLIENFMSYLNLGKRNFLKLSRTKNADEYDNVIEKINKKSYL